MNQLDCRCVITAEHIVTLVLIKCYYKTIINVLNGILIILSN